MTAASSESSLVAQRYAAALLDMANESSVADKVEQDVRDLLAMLAQSADLRALAANPLFDREKQKSAVQALADQAKLQPLTRNFLGILAQNRRLGALEGVLKAFLAALATSRGEMSARVQTAFPLSADQTKRLQDELGKALGLEKGARVTLDVQIDKSLLGGMVVTVGSRMIDDSVRRKLERLQRAMSAGQAA